MLVVFSSMIKSTRSDGGGGGGALNFFWEGSPKWGSKDLIFAKVWSMEVKFLKYLWGHVN